jgi:uncharacterized repeat protein (TIGR03803 family)
MDGTDYSILYDFRRRTGAQSHSCLVEGNGALDRMTAKGGAHEHGVMFQIALDSSEFDVNYDVKGTSGSEPHCALALCGNVLYGMTTGGGAHKYGAIFAVPVTGD